MVDNYPESLHVHNVEADYIGDVNTMYLGSTGGIQHLINDVTARLWRNFLEWTTECVYEKKWSQVKTSSWHRLDRKKKSIK